MVLVVAAAVGGTGYVRETARLPCSRKLVLMATVVTLLYEARPATPVPTPSRCLSTSYRGKLPKPDACCSSPGIVYGNPRLFHALFLMCGKNGRQIFVGLRILSLLKGGYKWHFLLPIRLLIWQSSALSLPLLMCGKNGLFLCGFTNIISWKWTMHETFTIIVTHHISSLCILLRRIVPFFSCT